MKKKKTLVVIPARYDSSRFPGKPLAIINGIPMIQRTYNQALKNKYTKDIVVATDSQKIYSFCKQNEMNVVMTSNKCFTGTDRVAEVAENFHDFDCFVNLQGDEPVIDPKYIDKCIKFFYDNYPKYDVVTGYGTLGEKSINLEEKVKLYLIIIMRQYIFLDYQYRTIQINIITILDCTVFQRIHLKYLKIEKLVM